MALEDTSIGVAESNTSMTSSTKIDSCFRFLMTVIMTPNARDVRKSTPYVKRQAGSSRPSRRLLIAAHLVPYLRRLRWRSYHVLAWQQRQGPIPSGGNVFIVYKLPAEPPAVSTEGPGQ